VGIELTGCDTVYAWDKVEGAMGFHRVNLFPTEDIDRVRSQVLSNRLHKALNSARPDAVAVPGWSDRGAIAALQWCGETGTPAIMMSESTHYDETRTAWKEWMKRRLVRMCAAGLSGGVDHADYLVELGMPRDRVFLGYDAVDNEHFAAKAEECRKERGDSRNQKEESRDPLPISDLPSPISNLPSFLSSLPKSFFLASARFVEKKNLARLIQAYAKYRELASKAESGNLKPEIWSLVLLGDGPLKSDLCHLMSKLGLKDHVLLPGFKQYDELPVYYGAASTFVHASTTEQWGLVVNEAMASGLPVLVSNRCGCAHDLVKDGVNGFSFDPFDVEQLAQLMLKISAFNFPLSAFAESSREIISEWGAGRFADGLKQAVECALKNPRPKATLIDRLLLKLLLLRK
jgi:glycosyltransferase involved in cell wall biosynthesis